MTDLSPQDRSVPETTPDPARTGRVMTGVYFDGKTSHSHAARAWREGDRLILHVTDEPWEVPLSAVEFEPALGRYRRVLRMPGPVRFETDDHALVTEIERHVRANRGMGFVHALERRWQTALALLLVIVLAGVGFVQFGVPAVAGVAARATPPTLMQDIDNQVVPLLDRMHFNPSRLGVERQEALQQEFDRITAWAGGPYGYRLLFRAAPELGANALALPYGTVIVTDQLVALTDDDRGLVGVLAHEVGHVQQRHALQAMYRSLGLGVVAFLVTGDLATAGSIAVTLPTTLLESGYSREMEREADDVAAAYMLRAYGTTEPLQDLFRGLHEAHGGADSGENPLSFLETHPGVQERVERLQRMDTPQD